MANTREGRIKQFCLSKGITVRFYNKQLEKELKWCYRCESWKKRNKFKTDNSRWDKKKADCTDCTNVKEKKCLKGRASAFKGKKHSKKTIELFKQINSGKGNPNWKGGITKLITSIRNSNRYKEWRLNVYYAGKFTCAECETKKVGRNIILDADHIKPIYLILLENGVKTLKAAMKCKEIFDVKNGRCLCRECHKKTSTWGINKYKKQWEQKQI